MPKRICSVPECGSPCYGNHCPKHAMRLRRLGTTEIAPRPTPEERFWANVEQTDGCWIWKASKYWDGYGKFYADGHSCRAHRFSYELLVAPIPDGLQIDHLCRNIVCVNPAHLEPVTARENTLRWAETVTHCPQGHEYDAANTYRRMNGARVCRTCDRIRAMQKRNNPPAPESPAHH